MKKRKKVICFSIMDYVYGARILVQVGGDSKKLQETVEQMFKKERKKSPTGNAAMPTDQTQACCFIINDFKPCGVWFRKLPGAITLAHETMHLTYHILSESGLFMSTETEEAYAYFQGFLMNKLIGELW